MKLFLSLIVSLLISFNLFALDNSASLVGLDVRSPAELQANPSPGSMNIPLENVQAEVIKKIPNKETPIEVFCESGRRAGIALGVLKQLGYTNVTNIRSWRDWNKKDQKKAEHSEHSKKSEKK